MMKSFVFQIGVKKRKRKQRELLLRPLFAPMIMMYAARIQTDQIGFYLSLEKSNSNNNDKNRARQIELKDELFMKRQQQ